MEYGSFIRLRKRAHHRVSKRVSKMILKKKRHYTSSEYLDMYNSVSAQDPVFMRTTAEVIRRIDTRQAHEEIGKHVVCHCRIG